ncbi:hypothetical protein F4776DRAFT_660895 [Hypoxylon sp. NC0597]|nr:hypothetical protein F4776DRAFT_660895 [Hypoxylon sp. NC0597]
MMKVSRGLITTLALLVPAAWAFPRQLDTATAATTVDSVTPTPTTTPPPSAIDSATSTLHCDYSYCNSLGSNVCFYWAGYTSWDVSRGPIPGETPTILGPCSTET